MASRQRSQIIAPFCLGDARKVASEHRLPRDWKHEGRG
jgi:hypothetical protein